MMFVIIVAKEELTDEVFADLQDDFAVSGLGRPVDLLLNECVDSLATNSAVTNLDRVTVCTEMDTSTLGGFPPVNVEDLGIAECNALGRLLADAADKSRIGRRRTRNGEHILGGSIKIIKL